MAATSRYRVLSAATGTVTTAAAGGAIATRGAGGCGVRGRCHTAPLNIFHCSASSFALARIGNSNFQQRRFSSSTEQTNYNGSNQSAIATTTTGAAPLSSSSSSSASSTVVSDPFVGPRKEFVSDNEIRDAEFLFRSVWNKLLEKYGEQNLVFPKDIMWLAGAPGAGKGEMTPLISQFRGITSPPLEVGALLTSPEAMKIKADGRLVGDQQVIELLFEQLLKPEYESGVLVDGFPRTKSQAGSMKLLYEQMQLLRTKYANTPLQYKFRRPVFHITVLYIDKDESVRRQLRRGRLAQQHNDIVLATGVGSLKSVRETDLDPRLAEERYRQFQTQVYESLKLVKESFHFHFIDASGTPAEVQQRIINELKYQSAMELGDETFEKVRKVPLASEIIVHARHELVKRLDNYRSEQSELFDSVIQVIMNEFLHIIRRQALSGKAVIRTENKLFNEPSSVDMALDILCERGYVVALDITKKREPYRVNLETGGIETKETKVWEFQIEFQRPTIRRG